MTKKPIRFLAINFPFVSSAVAEEATLFSDRALFDFDVVVIRPEQFQDAPGRQSTYAALESTLQKKHNELDAFFAQGGVLVVLLDVPHEYTVVTKDYSGRRIYRVNNYEFLSSGFASGLETGTGQQVTYTDAAEPFVNVLKNSRVQWTAYMRRMNDPSFNALKSFGFAGAGGVVAAKMPYGDGHLILLPNLYSLDEKSFFEACGEYFFELRGTPPPDWTHTVFLPGVAPIEAKIVDLEEQISKFKEDLVESRKQLDDQSAYKQLLYEKGKAKLEPIVLRALDALGFETTPGELIVGTNFEIDGRTKKGSRTGLVEVKGSRKQIALDEFSTFAMKLLEDLHATNIAGKGILVGNGLCESLPTERLGSETFAPHVLTAARTHSIALINTVELYWLCCTLLSGDVVDLNAVRETILASNGYVDLRPFCITPSPFVTS